MKILYALLILILITASAHAAPSISSVSGTISNGSEVTVAGSSFGTGATILTWDNFEAHTTGTDLAGGSLTPVTTATGNWTTFKLSPSTDPVEISTTRAHGGSKSVFIDWTSETINSFGWDGKGPYSQLYISYWRYMTGTYSTSDPDNHKQFYLYGTNTCSGLNEAPQGMPLMPQGSSTWGYYVNNSTSQPNYSGTNNLSSNSTYGTGNTKTWSNTSNAWNRWEFWQKINSSYSCTPGSNCDGELTYWVDATKIYERDDYKFAFCSGSWKGFRLGHMAQGMVGSAEAWFDDVYIATSPARVEVGNASTWSACTHREIQPFTSWATGSISVTFNQGSFANGSTAYVYVVDSAGDISSGSAITIGGSDTTPPTVTAASINAAGTSLTLTMSEAVTVNDGTGFSATLSTQGATTCTIDAATSTSLVFTLNNEVLDGETGTFAYVTVSDGIEDAAGNDLASITGQAITNNSTNVPSVAIVSPTYSSTYSTSVSTLDISGTATGYDLASVAWSNSAGGSGACTGTSTWSKTGITLYAGTNIITITATDDAGNTATDTLTVTYAPSTPSTGGVVVSGCTLSGLEIN